MKPKRGTLTTTLPSGPAQTHGGYSFLATGKLPAHRRMVLAYLSAARAGLVRDLGPTEQDLTAAQIILIDRTVTALGIVRCIEEHVRENSVMRGSDLAPALQQSYLAYVNHVRLNLAALGIKTRAGENVWDLQAYVREHDKKKSEIAARKASPKARAGKAEAGGDGMDDSAAIKQNDPGASGGDFSGQREGGIDCPAESGQGQAPEGGRIDQPEPLGEAGEGERQ